MCLQYQHHQHLSTPLFSQLPVLLLQHSHPLASTNINQSLVVITLLFANSKPKCSPVPVIPLALQ